MNREELKALNDERLREILLAEFESSGTDVELIQTITDILRERHPENERDAHETYREFENEYCGTELLFDEKVEKPRSRRKRQRWKRVVVAVAAVLVALLGATVVASAAGIDIWGIIRDWTQETFGFETKVSDDAIERVEPNPIAFLNEMLVENGMEPLNQIKIPTGYKVVAANLINSRRGNLIVAEYSDGNDTIMISIQKYEGEDASRYFPKDDEDPETVLSRGITYYVTTNEGWTQIVWVEDEVVVEIGCSDYEILLQDFIMRRN